MLLVIDMGNTAITMALMKSRDEICAVERVSTKQCLAHQDAVANRYVADAFDILLKKSHVQAEDVTGVMVSSVVPHLTSWLCDVAGELTNSVPLTVDCEKKLNITLGYETVSQLGHDLITVSVASVHDYEGPIAVFDMGTATTCSVIDADACYRGTIIIPGLMISKDALIAQAAQLFDVALEPHPPLIGVNTVQAMQSGFINGTAAMIDGLILRLKEELGAPVTVLLTGGAASFIAPLCRQQVIYDENLLLKGLWDIYLMNC